MFSGGVMTTAQNAREDIMEPRIHKDLARQQQYDWQFDLRGSNEPDALFMHEEEPPIDLHPAAPIDHSIRNGMMIGTAGVSAAVLAFVVSQTVLPWVVGHVTLRILS